MDIASSLNNYFSTAAKRILSNLQAPMDYEPSTAFSLFLIEHHVIPNQFGIP